MKGVCRLSWIPLRKFPQSSAEMVSSLIYGETYEVLNREVDWLEIQTDFDFYKGFIASEQFQAIAENSNQDLAIVTEAFLVPSSQHLPPIISGGSIVNEKDISLDFHKAIKPIPNFSNPKVNRDKIIQTAQKFFGINYLWGGRSYAGIDCSGFTQIVYKINGISIPRDSKPQSEFFNSIPFEELQMGDLVFLGKTEDKINHVGIYMGDQKIIHASGSVRIDSLNRKGILLANGGYSHLNIRFGNLNH